MFLFNRHNISIQCLFKGIVSILFFIVFHVSCYAQYINKVLDYNNTSDWGYDIYVGSDSNYIILGGSRDTGWGASFMKVTKDGNLFLHKNIIKNTPSNCFEGSPGRIKQFLNGDFLVPLTVDWPIGSTGNSYRSSGYSIFDSTGTVIKKMLYTDTSKDNELLNDCAILPDSGFLFCGYRAVNNAAIAQQKGLVRRTDKHGNILWEKVYTGYNNDINSVQLLPNGKILIGAEQTNLIVVGQYFYYKRVPNFIIADSSNGNIIKFVYLYDKCGGGNVSKDANGGYFHWGRRDTMAYPTNPDAYLNFPDYLMKLDDSFKVVWYKEFKWSLDKGHRYFFSTKQTKDNGYIVMGSREIFLPQYNPNNTVLFGWAAKLNAQGYVEWEHDYVIDSTQQAYITDMVETPSSGYAFTGNTRDNSLPIARQYDAWLIVTDSNGCLVPGCDPLAVDDKKLTLNAGEVLVYPNPMNDHLIIKGLTKGSLLQLFDITGREVMQTIATQSFQELNTSSLTPGTYILQLTDKEGSRLARKLVKQ